MLINVRLLNGYKEIFTYTVPTELASENLVGTLIKVPFQKRIETALVCEQFEHLKNPVSFALRTAHSLEPFPQDTYYQQFIKQLSIYYALDPFYFFKRVRIFLKEKEEIEQSVTSPILEHRPLDVTLSEDQKIIVAALTPIIESPRYYPSLLHGVTGSGKTEIYKQLIMHALSCNKSVLLLLPEVSLAVQFTQLLKKQLPESVLIYGFHSATSIKEKRTLWEQLLTAQPIVIIGVHLPVLLPIANLGVIIIDEEHDVGFQEKKYPRINTKEAALLRAQLAKIPIVLGSATPSLSSLYTAQTKNWHFFSLKHRFAGAFPTIQRVKLTENKEQRAHFWITKELQTAIADRLAKKEQTILFLNRRGHSFFIQCTGCGFIPACLQCSVTLTFHNNGTLICHYCNFTQAEPTACSSCKLGPKNLLKKGVGTQQIVAILEKLFPAARIARADLDATVNKKNWQQTINDFQSGTLDILVGTQTITKGYHFPKVTLVGILWADVNLSFPVYNAAEVTLQQLIQVAGRAGRQSTESLVVVQCMLDHPVFNYLNEIDYLQFYNFELEKRTIVRYPPVIRLAEIELRHTQAACVEKEADKVADFLITYTLEKNLSVTVLGPAQPPVHRIKNVSMRKIYLKCPDINQLLRLYAALNKNNYQSTLFFTPNPLN